MGYNSRIHHQNQENERLFNLYESVSSSLCYAGDLQELLTTIISIIVSELPSEEGSILLFNDESNELEFFSAHDKRILMGIADEVDLAVKNARVFDYVVNSYCKIRQGQMSCKGCVRPLKSWTPCARQLDLL